MRLASLGRSIPSQSITNNECSSANQDQAAVFGNSTSYESRVPRAHNIQSSKRRVEGEVGANERRTGDRTNRSREVV